jgi:iron complex transport system ATP-binding protein
VGISEFADRTYPTLSGGEKQRVQMARILAQLWGESDEPKLLFLDEPTSALDLKHQEVALRIAQRICRTQRTAVVVVLHDLNLASAWSDRIVLMKSGRLVRRGLPSQVLTTSALRQVYDVDVLCLPHPTSGRPIVIAGSGGNAPPSSH